MMIPVNEVPKILAFDTSSVRGSVALLEGVDMRAEMRLNSLQTHSAQLLSSIDFLLARAGWSLKDLSLVAVGIGPGSFTGIRIGIATALGFAQSLSIPLAGISGLDALAHQFPFQEGHVVAVLDAHRAQVFCGEYIRREGRIRRAKSPYLIQVTDLEGHFDDKHTYIVGDLKACRLDGIKHALPRGWPRPVFADQFLASTIGRLALSRKRNWRSGNAIVAEPLYIRPPDALKNKGRKS
jgi:tRNA threonylcarbamoyladenosine biosynthesis protein TsaB